MVSDPNQETLIVIVVCGLWILGGGLILWIFDKFVHNYTLKYSPNVRRDRLDFPLALILALLLPLGFIGLILMIKETYETWRDKPKIKKPSGIFLKESGSGATSEITTEFDFTKKKPKMHSWR